MATRKYTAEEKEQLLANLDIEVSHRLRRFRAWAADVLEGYKIRQDGQLARIPKAVRALKMSVLADVHAGDLSAAFHALSSERIRAAQDAAIERSPRKRKFEAVAEAAAGEQNAPRASKNARTVPSTPRRKPTIPAAPTPQTATRMRTTSIRTPSGSARPPVRQRVPSMQPPSPSPFKRAASPTKPAWGAGSKTPAPSAPVFAPSNIPPGAPRMPRKDESLLSVNGSPVANPLASPYARTRHASGAVPPGQAIAGRGLHIRTTSQPSLFGGQTQQQAKPLVQARTFTKLDIVRESPRATSSLGSSSTTDASRPVTPATPPPGGAMITIPLRSGRLFSFDPLVMNEGEELLGLDELGMNEEEKRIAREEVSEVVGRLRKAVERWKI